MTEVMTVDLMWPAETGIERILHLHQCIEIRLPTCEPLKDQNLRHRFTTLSM